jgi:UDP-N-acetylenolpyruvoylglucosamine reductase
MDQNAVKQALCEYIAEVRLDEPMSRHTSFKVGGPADVMALPKTKEELLQALRALKKLGCPVFVMGRGTNLLVRSGGIRGAVIKLADNFSDITVEGEFVTAQSGAPLSALVRAAMEKGLGGISFLGGIPGTLGGAVAMNAGAYGGEIGRLVEEAYLVSPAGEAALRQGEMRFGYRRSVLGSYPLVVAGAKLKLSRVPADETKKELAELAERRREKQPLEYPSAGSTFKRPEGHYAGTLIERAGLKGASVGGAQVSEKHAGFIINTGGATPEDILDLIALVQRRVYESSGVTLEPEVKIAGEE